MGRDQLQRRIKDLLLIERSVTLTGIPGVGKTALALSLTADEEVAQRYFCGVLWVRLGPEPDVLTQLRELAIALRIPESQINNAFEVDDRARAILAASTMIHANIGARRFLIVVDDVWSPNDALAFKLGARCGHVFTTRIVAVASLLEGEEVAIPELSLHDSLTLFTAMAPQVTKWAPEDTQNLVSATGGLPLALVIFGRHLKAEARRGRIRHLTDELNRLKQAQERLRRRMPLPPVDQYPSLVPANDISLWTIINISYEALPPAAGTMFASL